MGTIQLKFKHLTCLVHHAQVFLVAKLCHDLHTHCLFSLP